MPDEYGRMTEAEFSQERQQAADYASQKMTENFVASQQRDYEAAGAKKQQDEEDQRRRGPISDKPIIRGKDSPWLWQIFLIGVCAFILFVCHLYQAATTSIPGFAAGVVMAGGFVFLASEPGYRFAKKLFLVIGLVVALFCAAIYAIYQAGMARQHSANSPTLASAHVKHQAHVKHYVIAKHPVHKGEVNQSKMRM